MDRVVHVLIALYCTLGRPSAHICLKPGPMGP